MKYSKTEQALRLVEKAGIVRSRDLEAHGIAREHVRRLYRRGLLTRVGRGLYSGPQDRFTEHHTLAQACKRVPHGIVCLLSALRLHGLTTQTPHEVWLAIGSKARSPKESALALRIVRFSGKALTSGIEERRIEGVTVKVYSPAKTVADCFKHRNKIGLDVALEALRDSFRRRRATMDDLWRYAAVCRVKNVMRPYLESLT